MMGGWTSISTMDSGIAKREYKGSETVRDEISMIREQKHSLTTAARAA